MKPFSRTDRVSVKMHKALSDILFKEIQDPRIKAATITKIKMSRDLKNARIYFVLPAGKKSIDSAIKGFKKAHGYIKRSLASQLELKYMPEIIFYYDDSFDYGEKIDRVLDLVNKHDKPDNRTS